MPDDTIPPHRKAEPAPKQCRTHFTDDPARIDYSRDPHLAPQSASPVTAGVTVSSGPAITDENARLAADPEFA